MYDYLKTYKKHLSDYNQQKENNELQGSALIREEGKRKIKHISRILLLLNVLLFLITFPIFHIMTVFIIVLYSVCISMVILWGAFALLLVAILIEKLSNRKS
ncbi:Uncharacterised protein [Clostridium putrefaciens]|uniref:Uncharacterized protein n=1 Tax=Clostridium putrefaciens TaxID=99675 RepID=A0A381J4K1_9CLOT|nr:hypothetical protein [Clostridium putrefaciens]SUY45220.1 Uncharacterised protein [Clostridium putrefaciens]